MAFFTDTHAHGTSFGARMLAYIGQARTELAKRRLRSRIIRQSISELSALSSRELNDLGIARGEIRRIATETADNAV